MNHEIVVGWKEYCALPDLKVKRITAKIDTGADTSALHALNIEPFVHRGHQYVKFDLYPKRYNDEKMIPCRARVIDYRRVRSSNGHHEHRYVIETTIQLGPHTLPIQVTLTNRSELNYRMLLGRDFLTRCLIDVSQKFCQGKPR